MQSFRAFRAGLGHPYEGVGCLLQAQGNHSIQYGYRVSVAAPKHNPVPWQNDFGDLLLVFCKHPPLGGTRRG